MKKGIEHRLQLGEIINLKASIFEKRLRISYAGEHAQERYSLAIIITNGYNSFAYNIYFGKTQKEILIPYGKITIIDVDEQSLHFMYRPVN